MLKKINMFFVTISNPGRLYLWIEAICCMLPVYSSAFDCGGKSSLRGRL